MRTPNLDNATNTLTTEATVTANKIEIHEDIYDHIRQFLANGDCFHAVDESYKVVRKELRELASSERATDVFNETAQSNKHYAALFGKATPSSPAEADFFRGSGIYTSACSFCATRKPARWRRPSNPTWPCTTSRSPVWLTT